MGVFSFVGCVENTCEAPTTNPLGYELQSPSGTTVTELGGVSCAAGYKMDSGSGHAPHASCITPGGTFQYSGCEENMCTPLSPNATAGYSFENITATTVGGLGTVSCAFGFNGISPAATCDREIGRVGRAVMDGNT